MQTIDSNKPVIICLVLQQEAEEGYDLTQQDGGPPTKRLCLAELDGSMPCSAPFQRTGWDHSYIQLEPITTCIRNNINE